MKQFRTVYEYMVIILLGVLIAIFLEYRADKALTTMQQDSGVPVNHTGHRE